MIKEKIIQNLKNVPSAYVGAPVYVGNLLEVFVQIEVTKNKGAINVIIEQSWDGVKWEAFDSKTYVFINQTDAFSGLFFPFVRTLTDCQANSEVSTKIIGKEII